MSRYSSSYPFSSPSILWTFLVIFLTFKPSSATDYQYEACAPKNCGHGPNISFPFHISGVQESYCGYPGFALNCSTDWFPVLELSENNYVIVQDIFYQYQSFLVYNSAVSGLSVDGGCVPKMIRNTTLPTERFNYVNVTDLHLFSNCSIPPEDQQLLSKYELKRCKDDARNNQTQLAVYEGDGETTLRSAVEVCTVNVVAPVQIYQEETNGGVVSDIVEALRRGFVMSWTASNCSTCKDSGGRCGFNEASYHFQCFCTDKPHSRSCTRRVRTARLALVISLAAAAMGAFIFIFLILFVAQKRNKRNRLALKNKNDMELFLKKNGGGVAPKRYRYSQLKKMTNKFKDSLGKGGYGTVYKGTSNDGSFVAVKVLDGTKGNGEEFLNEVACISRTSHVNIVSLLGFCLEGSKRALVYEYMPNGSLDKFLHDPSSSSSTEALAWEKMRGIALGIARGLEYLHQGCSIRILHFDIKPHNVLLDGDLRPKISDFGLAKLCPERASHVSMSGMRGTVGYIAPEVFSRNFGPVSYKSDVYSYGMMVLEMVGERTGKGRGGATSSAAYFPNWIYRNLEADFGGGGDGEISEDGDSRAVKRKLTIVGLCCIQNDPRERPSMAKVVEMLEGDAESLTVPPKPYLSSPAREVRKEAPVSSSSAVSSDFDVGN